MEEHKSIAEAFNFENKKLRVFGTIDEPWFCGKDVANILGYKNTQLTINKFVDKKYTCDIKNMRGIDSIPLSANEQNLKLINEQGLYCLIFNSKMEKAKLFRDWVFEEVLPSIRKNGYYVASNIDGERIKQLEKELREKKDQLNLMHNIQKELLSYKKRVTKTEIVYIVSTAEYARQGIFKIGRTKNAMKFRSSAHNTTHIQGDKIKALREFKVNDSALVERNIHTKLNGLLVEGEREFFMCPYDLLESLVDLIVHNDDEENDMVNKIIDTVYNLKMRTFDSVDWTHGVPAEAFNETLAIVDDDEKKLVEFDVSKWSSDHKKEFVANCLKEYVVQKNKVNEEYQIIWKTFQTFLVGKLPILKSRFKVADWKPCVKSEIKKEEKLTIKWRGLA